MSSVEEEVCGLSPETMLVLRVLTQNSEEDIKLIKDCLSDLQTPGRSRPGRCDLENTAAEHSSRSHGRPAQRSKTKPLIILIKRETENISHLN